MRLLLFDVDGTLIHAGRQVRPILAAAIADVFGCEIDFDGYRFSGKTDPLILVEILDRHGIPPAAARSRLQEVRASYVRRLERDLDPSGMRVLPAVRETLDAFAARTDLALGLLTGNWEPGARIKLERVGLDRYFAFGAYGCDGEDRADLPPRALDRARAAHGLSFDPGNTVIVGDSTEDVRCGRAHGIPVIAVTTGWTAAEELRRAGATAVLDTLADLPARLEGIA